MGYLRAMALIEPDTYRMHFLNFTLIFHFVLS